MRTILLFTLLCLISVSLNAQKLAGVVYDRENQEPVTGAHVYIEGSSLYDVTNAEGQFEIKVNSFVNLPLAISHISYNSLIIQNPFTTLPDTIFLEGKENVLGEVIVETGRYSRRQLLRAFRREFLGSSAAAQSCLIENEDKIDIWFNRLTHKLSASCDEPILIHNRLLGYQIYLTLEKFEVEYPGRQLGVGFPLQTVLEGSAFFEDLAPSNQTISNRRERIFAGSPTHFLRVLANEQLVKFNYIPHQISDRLEVDPSFCFIVQDSLDQKKIRVTPRLKPLESVLATYHGRLFWGEIGVRRNRTESSRIIFFTETFFVDAWGNLSNPEDILFMGFMGHFRIGDQLPVDYGIDNSKPSPK